MSKEEMLKVIYEKIGVDYLMDDGLAGIKTYHPVMIGDVLDWIEKSYILCDKVYDVRTQKRLPIDDQSEECISFIYNLVKDE